MSNQYCQSCGHPNALDSNFCAGCGQSMKSGASSVSQIIASIKLNKPTRQSQQEQKLQRPDRFEHYQEPDEEVVINVPDSLDMGIKVMKPEGLSLKDIVASEKTGFGRPIQKLSKKAAKQKLNELLARQATLTRHNIGGETE